MSSDDLYVLHRIIRSISAVAAKSFFSEVRVIGGENVPRTGPIIVAATHHNMMLDPLILSIAFPYQRILNYWSKASLFASPILSWILYSSGNIPVDRKSKDRKKLFEGTFKALANESAVAVFPEGTSYTQPKIMQVKDGVAWAALEFAKHAKESGIEGPDVMVVPAAIVYTNKSKYRSCVVMEFGKPIKMDPYMEQFLSPTEGDPRAAVKRLTKAIEASLIEHTVNAADWDSLYTARMARDILWPKKPVPLDDFVAVSQTLVDLFSPDNSGLTNNFASTKRALLRYYSLLQSTHLSHSTLSSLPLPRSLDPSSSVPLPSRLYTLLILLRDTTLALLNLPFFFLPLLFHLPVYFFSRFGAHLVQDEEETQAQNKIFFGLFSVLFVYPLVFILVSSLFLFKPFGFVVGAIGVYMVWMHHTRMVDRFYGRFKSLICAWRVLVGVWAPKRWEFGGSVVEEQYGKPYIPDSALNPWLENENKEAQAKSLLTPELSTANEPPPNFPLSPQPSLSAPLAQEIKDSLTKKPKPNPHRRPPSRRIMKHVLRARVEAVRALALFFEELELVSYGSSEGAAPVVHSSPHLARDGKTRNPKEVIAFLKARGGVIPSLTTSRTRIKEEGDATDWGAGTSDAGDDSGRD